MKKLTPRLRVPAFVVLAFFFATNAVSAGELVMFRQAACEWCEAWDREIGETYGKTSVGRGWPIRHVDIHKARPPDLVNIKAVVYTPTFVIVENGAEIGRILGYTGEGFFWGLLEKIVAKSHKNNRTASPTADAFQSARKQ